MKTLIISIAALFTLFNSNLALAAMTKGEVIQLAASSLINENLAVPVEGCRGIKDAGQLYECVVMQAMYDLNFYYLPNNAIVNHTIRISFENSSGDCMVSVYVDAKRRAVAEITPWLCN